MHQSVTPKRSRRKWNKTHSFLQHTNVISNTHMKKIHFVSLLFIYFCCFILIRDELKSSYCRVACHFGCYSLWIIFNYSLSGVVEKIILVLVSNSIFFLFLEIILQLDHMVLIAVPYFSWCLGILQKQPIKNWKLSAWT